MNSLARLFESLLWNSRLVVIVAVIASVLVGMGAFYLATVDMVEVFVHIAHYTQAEVIHDHKHAEHPKAPAGKEAVPDHGDAELAAEEKEMMARDKRRELVVAGIIEVIDGYLLAATMIIFALGLYELFIRKIEAATESEHAENILLIRSLDDLKDRLAKMIMLMLAIKFFKESGRMSFETRGPLELLYLAFGVVLIAGSIYITHAGGHGHKHDKEDHGDDKEHTPAPVKAEH